MSSWRHRFIWSSTLVGILGVAHADDRFEDAIRPVLDTYCIDCHGPDKQKARLRFDGVRGFQVSDRHLWTKIHEQLSHGEMPPEDEPQLSSSDKAKVLAWIVKEQRALGAGSTLTLAAGAATPSDNAPSPSTAATTRRVDIPSAMPFSLIRCRLSPRMQRCSARAAFTLDESSMVAQIVEWRESTSWSSASSVSKQLE